MSWICCKRQIYKLQNKKLLRINLSKNEMKNIQRIFIILLKSLISHLSTRSRAMKSLPKPQQSFIPCYYKNFFIRLKRFQLFYFLCTCMKKIRLFSIHLISSNVATKNNWREEEDTFVCFSNNFPAEAKREKHAYTHDTTNQLELSFEKNTLWF